MAGAGESTRRRWLSICGNPRRCVRSSSVRLMLSVPCLGDAAVQEAQDLSGRHASMVAAKRPRLGQTGCGTPAVEAVQSVRDVVASPMSGQAFDTGYSG